MAPRSIAQVWRRPPVEVAESYRAFASGNALRADSPKEVDPRGRHVVLASFMPLSYSLKVEGALAAGLAQRGWRASVLAPYSVMRWVKAYHGDVHGLDVRCFEDYVDLGQLGAIDARIDAWLGEGADPLSFATVRRWSYRDIPIGIHALATISSANPEGRIEFTSATVAPLKRTLRRSILWAEAAFRFLEEERPNLVLANEKGFMGTCEIYYAALRRGIDFVQWVGCHEPDSLMFKRYSVDNERDHPFSIGPAAWARTLQRPWCETQRETLHRVLLRGYEAGDWYRYKKLAEGQKQAEKAELVSRLGLDAGKPTAIIYSHILNDANLFYGDDLFTDGYEQWLVETVRAALRNPRVNWVLKIHPANRARNARMGYQGEYGEVLALRRAFGGVPKALHVVFPEDDVSPLSFFRITDWGLTVRGTVGLELPCFGVPVLTAGTGRYSGKGFTEDSESVDQYLARVQEVDRVPRLSEERVRRAIAYALAVFCARPARYGEVFRDVYPPGRGTGGERDLRPAPDILSLSDAVNATQWRRIIDYLEDRMNEDFLDLRAYELATSH
jgi:hypothetical protein